MPSVLVAKPDGHKFLFECLLTLKSWDQINTLEFNDQKGHGHIYEWFNGAPLNGSKQADNVNFFEYTIISDDKTTFHCRWIKDILINQANVKMFVKGGRSRLKIAGAG